MMMIESNNHIVVMEAWSSRKTECTFAKKLVKDTEHRTKPVTDDKSKTN